MIERMIIALRLGARSTTGFQRRRVNLQSSSLSPLSTVRLTFNPARALRIAPSTSNWLPLEETSQRDPDIGWHGSVPRTARVSISDGRSDLMCNVNTLLRHCTRHMGHTFGWKFGSSTTIWNNSVSGPRSTPPACAAVSRSSMIDSGSMLKSNGSFDDVPSWCPGWYVEVQAIRVAGNSLSAEGKYVVTQSPL